MSTSSPIVLASGAITASDAVAVELVDTKDTPKMIMIQRGVVAGQLPGVTDPAVDATEADAVARGPGERPEAFGLAGRTDQALAGAQSPVVDEQHPFATSVAPSVRYVMVGRVSFRLRTRRASPAPGRCSSPRSPRRAGRSCDHSDDQDHLVKRGRVNTVRPGKAMPSGYVEQPLDSVGGLTPRRGSPHRPRSG